MINDSKPIAIPLNDFQEKKAANIEAEFSEILSKTKRSRVESLANLTFSTFAGMSLGSLIFSVSAFLGAYGLGKMGLTSKMSESQAKRLSDGFSILGAIVGGGTGAYLTGREDAEREANHNALQNWVSKVASERNATNPHIQK